MGAAMELGKAGAKAEELVMGDYKNGKVLFSEHVTVRPTVSIKNTGVSILGWLNQVIYHAN